MIISNSRWGTTMCGKPYMVGQSRCSIIISVSEKTLFVWDAHRPQFRYYHLFQHFRILYNHQQRPFQVKVDPSLSLSHHYRWIVQFEHWLWRNYHLFQDLWVWWFLLHGEPKCGWNKDTWVELRPVASRSKCLRQCFQSEMSSSSSTWKPLVIFYWGWTIIHFPTNYLVNRHQPHWKFYSNAKICVLS